MVLSALARSPQPHVLPIRVRQQEQLQPPDQSGELRQSGPSALFQIRRSVIRFCYQI